MFEFLNILQRYPRITILDLRIMLLLFERPGFSIRETADCLNENFKIIQERVAILASGRKRRNGKSCYKFLTDDMNVFDKRKRSLALTLLGEDIITQLHKEGEKNDNQSK